MKPSQGCAVNNAKKPIVVLDTQILLRSVGKPNSLTAKIVFGMSNQYEFVISQLILAEINDVLSRPQVMAKMKLTDERIRRITEVIAGARQVQVDNIAAVSRDPKDDKFLATALAADAHYIVSEDKDLLVLDPYQKIRIVNALDSLPTTSSDDLPPRL